MVSHVSSMHDAVWYSINSKDGFNSFVLLYPLFNCGALRRESMNADECHITRFSNDGKIEFLRAGVNVMSL